MTLYAQAFPLTFEIKRLADTGEAYIVFGNHPSELVLYLRGLASADLRILAETLIDEANRPGRVARR